MVPLERSSTVVVSRLCSLPFLRLGEVTYSVAGFMEKNKDNLFQVSKPNFIAVFNGQRRRNPSGLNYSPRPKVFRRGQKAPMQRYLHDAAT